MENYCTLSSSNLKLNLEKKLPETPINVCLISETNISPLKCRKVSLNVLNKNELEGPFSFSSTQSLNNFEGNQPTSEDFELGSEYKNVEEFPKREIDTSCESSMHIQVYDSVQAVIKEEICQLLGLQDNTTILDEIKNCSSEEFKFYEKKEGHFTFVGKLKDLIICQELLRSYLKKTKEVPHRKNKNYKDINVVSSYHSKKTSSCKHSDSLGNLNSCNNCETLSPNANTRSCNKSFLQTFKNMSESISAGKCNDVSLMNHSDQSNIKQLIKGETSLQKLFNPSNVNNGAMERKKSEHLVSSKFSSVKEEKNSTSLNASECGNSFEGNVLTLCESDFGVPLDSLSGENLSDASQSQRLFSCCICPFQCTKSSQLKKHQILHEKNTKLYKCITCNFMTFCQSQLGRHKRRHKQPILDVQFPMDKNKIEKKKFVCEICGFQARLKREYKSHLELVHPISYSCAQCPYRTSKKVHYIRHVRNVHENQRPYKCPSCGLAFKRQDALKQHQVIHYKESKLTDRQFKAPFKCHICKKVVRSAAYLKEHLLTHADERSFLCEICGASFKTRSVHRNHLKVVHSQELKPTCRFCTKTFATKYSLNRHMNQHEISPNFGFGDKCILKDARNSKYHLIKNPRLNSKQESCWTRVIFKPDEISKPQTSRRRKALEPKENDSEAASSAMCNILSDHHSNDNIIVTSHSELTSSSYTLNIDDQIPYIIDSTTEVSNEVISEVVSNEVISEVVSNEVISEVVSNEVISEVE